MTPTVQNHQEPVVGSRGFSFQWLAHTARTTSLNHVNNNTKEKSQVNLHLYRSHSNATSRFREHILLLSSLLERLWYNCQYIYNDTNQYTSMFASPITTSTILHQFYYPVGITNNKSSDIQLLLLYVRDLHTIHTVPVPSKGPIPSFTLVSSSLYLLYPHRDSRSTLDTTIKLSFICTRCNIPKSHLKSSQVSFPVSFFCTLQCRSFLTTTFETIPGTSFIQSIFYPIERTFSIV